jgi:D-alanyl-D-alanine carboxypeptidase
MALAAATSTPARVTSSANAAGPNMPAESAHAAAAIGSTDPIRPVFVKTLAVRAGRTHAPAPASLAPVHTAFQEEEPAAEGVSSAPAERKAQNEPGAEGAIVAVVESPKPAVIAAVTPAPLSTPAPAPAETTAAARGAKTAKATEKASEKPTEKAIEKAAEKAIAKATAKPQVRSGWVIQVGAFQAEAEAKQRLSKVQSKASKILDGADPFTETVDKGGTTYYRARFAGLDKEKAEAACKYLKRNDVECVPTKY